MRRRNIAFILSQLLLLSFVVNAFYAYYNQYTINLYFMELDAVLFYIYVSGILIFFTVIGYCISEKIDPEIRWINKNGKKTISDKWRKRIRIWQR